MLGYFSISKHHGLISPNGKVVTVLHWSQESVCAGDNFLKATEALDFSHMATIDYSYSTNLQTILEFTKYTHTPESCKNDPVLGF